MIDLKYLEQVSTVETLAAVACYVNTRQIFYVHTVRTVRNNIWKVWVARTSHPHFCRAVLRRTPLPSRTDVNL
jgi:hypothetical protein